MRIVLFSNCCFQVILTACSLHAYRLSTRVMLHVCVYNTHACSSADSFAVGSGVWSVFVMFSLAFQSRILFPAKRYFEGLTAKYFSRGISKLSLFSNDILFEDPIWHSNYHLASRILWVVSFWRKTWWWDGAKFIPDVYKIKFPGLESIWLSFTKTALSLVWMDRFW
jgi:hypothetical protein